MALLQGPVCSLVQSESQPHVNEWHNHNPLPGTVYDLGPRLNHPSLVGRPDVLAVLERLHQMTPWSYEIAWNIASRKYNGRPNYEQAMALYGALLPYSAGALQQVAASVTDDPPRYEELMLQASALNPICYYALVDYLLARNQEDKAADYMDKACAADPDAVRVSNHSRWRVRYYLNKGQTERAREIADEAAEVYSSDGLEAKGIFLEATTNYAGAFEWFAKIEERYGNSNPVIDFCLRYKNETDDTRFDDQLEKRVRKLFPKGIEKAALQDFAGPPADGVLIKGENDLLKASGLKQGDVIVAVFGVRVHNLRQYVYGRYLKQTPEMDLIVWQGDAYREFKPSPPRRRFGVEFGDYSTGR